MPIRYYPSFYTVKNQSTAGGEFTLDGQPYIGKYYVTLNGRYFTGPTPEDGPNEELELEPVYAEAPILNNGSIPPSMVKKLVVQTQIKSTRIPGKPNSFYPQPTEADYSRGYLIRYFTRKENETIITEINEDEYSSIVNGTADYDISIYQTSKILWKITGPLNSQRKSQYNIIPGIIDTNQRLTETANKTFLGILDYIGGEYTKFARPTS
jgi:hypothetical protein